MSFGTKKKITFRKLVTFLKYKINAAKNSLVRTKVPFTPNKIAQTNKIMDKCLAGNGERILFTNPSDFPKLDELQIYWGIYKNITKMMHRHNRGDQYYDWAYLYDQITQQDRVVAKDLFEMWYMMHYQPKSILEIGSRTGKSLLSKLICHADIENTLIFSIDPFVEQGSPAKLMRNAALLGSKPSGLISFVGFSENIIPEIKSVWPELNFDYILVDGSHDPEDAYIDLCNCVDIMGKGSVICFDDLGPGKNELLSVWEKWKQKHGEYFVTKEYYVPYGFAVARKKIKPTNNQECFEK